MGKELVWIMGPYLGWGMTGWNGEGELDTNLYLLDATDKNGEPEDVVFHLEIQNTDSSASRAGRVDLYHPAGTR